MALREYLRHEDGTSTPRQLIRAWFVVGTDGKISNLKAVRGLRADYNAEAPHIACEGPAWQSGIVGGHRTPLPMEVVVPF